MYRPWAELEVLYKNAPIGLLLIDAKDLRIKRPTKKAETLGAKSMNCLGQHSYIVDVFFAGTAVSSFAGETKAMTDAPRSRVSCVVNMLGDFIAFWASFLILGDVIAAGALGILKFYLRTTQDRADSLALAL